MNGINLGKKLKTFIKTYIKIKNIEDSYFIRYNFIYKNYLRIFKKYSFSPHPPKKVKWINTTLKSIEEIINAIKILKEAGLPLNKRVIEKNWDSLIALNLILRNSDTSANILDAGGTESSLILHWLYQFGYLNLKCINLIFKERKRKGLIDFIPGDLTKTHFPNNYFDIITCISVIEHGIDEDHFFTEMNRILKKKGLIIISTDYWETKIETRNKFAYNKPVFVYDEEAIKILIRKAIQKGFKIYGPAIDLACQNKVVSWIRFNLKFTFLIFCLQKVKEI